MRRLRWVLVGLAIVLAIAAAVRSASMHGTGSPVRDEAVVGGPVAENWAERLTADPPPPSARLAPEFPRDDADGWINSAPLSMRALRGKVVVLDIWTFG
ncbi:MAG TPA: hypothetical protein VFQ07_07510 [Candidatus Polarisedimenticolia bacterium]|nr:hypothetical protein [Candidatus Polarisedimenticolia bacterium]